MKPPSLQTPATQVDMVAIDFETTGSVAGQDALPWQIGVVKMRQGKVHVEESRNEYLYVPTSAAFNPRAPGRHAVLRDTLAIAPSLQEIWPDIHPWLVGTVLVAHNAGTEKAQLRNAAPMHTFGPWIDTLKLSRIAWPDRSSHKLEDLIEDLGLRQKLRVLCPDADPHDAWYDAAACGLLLELLLELPGWDTLTVDRLVNARPQSFYRR